MLEHKVLVGIDGGGTYTRVAVADMEGRLLANVKRQGGAFLAKDANAVENVCLAVLAAVEEAGCALGDVAALAAGVAGYDNKSDLHWVRKLTKIKGLRCPILNVNDAVVAHRGALLFEPGIIAIAGTGSVIAAITEKGEFIRNYDVRHYANNAARCLTQSSVEKILAGETDHTDAALVDQMLRYFAADDISALKALNKKDFGVDNAQKMKLFGDFAPAVTAAALDGSRLARQVCIRAAEETVEGIRLLGTRFTSAPVPVALIGSVANSTFIKNTIGEILQEEKNADYSLVEPALPPAFGAVLMAARLANIEAEPFQGNLAQSHA